MAKLGDSRTLEGPGAIPAQDHRRDIDVEKRSCRVALRVVDQLDDFVRYHIDDEELRGDVQGLSVWALDDRNTSPRPCVMWRHAWPSMIEPFGDGEIEEPQPVDPWPDLTMTPGANGFGDLGQDGNANTGGWLTRDPKQKIGDPSLYNGGNNPPATWQRF